METLKAYIRRGQHVPAGDGEVAAIFFEVEAESVTGHRYLSSYVVRDGASWPEIEMLKSVAEAVVIKAATEDRHGA